MDQAEAAQRSIRSEGGSATLPGNHLIAVTATTEYLHRQIRSWIFAGGIILNISVETLETRINFRRQAQQKNITLKIAQSKQPCQYFQSWRPFSGGNTLYRIPDQKLLLGELVRDLPRLFIFFIKALFSGSRMGAKQQIGVGISDHQSLESLELRRQLTLP